MNINKLYKRIRYWRQLRKGFKLLEGKPKEFVFINDRAILINGKDPLVSVDLTKGVVSQYKPLSKGNFITIYKVKPNESNPKL